ncbi:helix-turn-helix domain-containing protein [Spirillospora sp. NPDC047279]|uniref:helix-turn-helix domain-containing protein n=1 Tax=Spirillospora sp. NPDC047279 TaxID=3155478 RepID=UPI0033F89598
MLLLDTDAHPAHERVDAFQSIAAGESGTCTIEHEGPQVRIRLERWNFGPMTMFATQGTGIEVRRSTRQVRRDPVNTVSVTTQSRGSGAFAWNDHRQYIRPGTLVMANKTAGYDYGWSGMGYAVAFMVDADHLGVPEHLVRAAIPLLSTSPVAPLLLHHVRALHRDADRLGTEPGADALAAATLELTRALIGSVTAAPPRHAVEDTTLLTRILAYARTHLIEPDLTPHRIAHAHHISVRTLYRICENGGLSLEQWIIRRRLEGARQDLAAPQHAHRTIESIARSWGFTNPAHFSRRFRQFFGVTPGQWRRGHPIR